MRPFELLIATAVQRSAARYAAVLAVPTSVLTASAQAQSAQPFSLQAAAMVTTVRTGDMRSRGIGIEPQLRFNRLLSTENHGAVSLGIGAQYSLHTGADRRSQLAGLFVEPRWALPFSAGCAFPYLSARAGVLRLATDGGETPGGTAHGYVVGTGPGVIFRVTRNANLDVGVQLLRQRLGAIEGVSNGGGSSYAARVGVTLGLPR